MAPRWKRLTTLQIGQPRLLPEEVGFYTFKLSCCVRSLAEPGEPNGGDEGTSVREEDDEGNGN